MGGSTAKLPPLPNTPVAVPPLERHRRTDYPGASDIYGQPTIHLQLSPLPSRIGLSWAPSVDSQISTYWWASSRRDTYVDANMGVCGILPGIERAGTSKRATWIHPNHPEGIAYMTLWCLPACLRIANFESPALSLDMLDGNAPQALVPNMGEPIRQVMQLPGISTVQYSTSFSEYADGHCASARVAVRAVVRPIQCLERLAVIPRRTHTG